MRKLLGDVMAVDWVKPLFEGEESCIRILLSEEETRCLIDALSKYHGVDTIMKINIEDDDATHFFIENLCDRLRETLEQA